MNYVDIDNLFLSQNDNNNVTQHSSSRQKINTSNETRACIMVLI